MLTEGVESWALGAEGADGGGAVGVAIARRLSVGAALLGPDGAPLTL